MMEERVEACDEEEQMLRQSLHLGIIEMKSNCKVSSARVA
jgi:hypothetical protein